MAQFKDLIVTGVTRVVSKVYSPEFIGKLTGNADSATSASSSKSDVNVSCLRNIQAGTTDLVDGSSDLATGDIYVVYKE